MIYEDDNGNENGNDIGNGGKKLHNHLLIRSGWYASTIFYLVAVTSMYMGFPSHV